MIYIASNEEAATVNIPRFNHTEGDVELVLISKTRGEIVASEEVVGGTLYWSADIDSTTIPDGEYEYVLRCEGNVLDCGLAQVGEYEREIKTENLQNKKITYEG